MPKNESSKSSLVLSLWADGEKTVRSKTLNFGNCDKWTTCHLLLLQCGNKSYKLNRDIVSQSASHYERCGLMWTRCFLPKSAQLSHDSTSASLSLFFPFFLWILQLLNEDLRTAVWLFAFVSRLTSVKSDLTTTAAGLLIDRIDDNYDLVRPVQVVQVLVDTVH